VIVGTGGAGRGGDAGGKPALVPATIDGKPPPAMKITNSGWSGSELSLPAVLQKIAELACVVADATYGALGGAWAGRRLSDFITRGVTEAERRAIGNLPVGAGILGVLITEAYPLACSESRTTHRSASRPTIRQ
jgi:hypothetical protein